MKAISLSAVLLLVFAAACRASSAVPFVYPDYSVRFIDQSPAHNRVARGEAAELDKLIAAGIEQVNYTKGYDPAYVKLSYPNGDVPKETGVCADVIVRAFRAISLDLQKEVHEDMKNNFAQYPKTWGAKKPDTNIDHRRVGNLMKWFARKNKSLPVSDDPQHYSPGDVVAWELDGGRLHIGLVTDVKADDKTYRVVHNIGAGAQIEDVLFAWKVIGHYRFFNSNEIHTGAGHSQVTASETRAGSAQRKN